MSENGFNCYFPDRIMAELDDLASVKFLHHLYTDGKYQMYRCLDCGTVIKGNKIIEPAQAPIKENAQEPNPQMVKNGGSL